MDLTPNTHLSAATLIKQPVAGDLRLEAGQENRMQMVERWKGLYQHCQDVLRNVFRLSGDMDYSRFAGTAGSLVQAYPTPLPPPGLKWILQDAYVDEIEAGENGLLQLTWAAELSSDQFAVVSSWNLEWQAENYPPYAYCSNVSAHVDPGSTPLKSQRAAVEQCLHPPIGNNVMTNARLFQNDQGVVVKLNENEQKILEWKLADMHVIKHHPVMTRRCQVQNVKAETLEQALAQYSFLMVAPDVIDRGPEDAARQMGLSSYQWVTQGTRLQCGPGPTGSQYWNLEYVTQWKGALSVVQEFYSDDASKRWEFGEM